MALIPAKNYIKQKSLCQSICLRLGRIELDVDLICLIFVHNDSNAPDNWRDGRVAEGGGLLNRYRVKSSIGGSNPPLSASVTSKLNHIIVIDIQSAA